MNPAASRRVEVYRAKSLPEAHAIRLYLADHGVTAVIDGETLQGVIGDWDVGWAAAPRIMVSESDSAQAISLIRERELSAADRESNDTDQDLCLSCGQPMQADASVCSSCGWSYLGIEGLPPGRIE